MSGPQGAARAKPAAPVRGCAERSGTRDAPAPGGGDAAAALRLVVGDWSALHEAATMVRLEVFVREQGVALELEHDDRDAASTHCVAFAADGRPVATGRLLPDGHVGRMAVLAGWRRAGLGSRVLERLVALAHEHGHRAVRLDAQQHAQDFYRAHGFEREGEPFEEAGIVHVAMRRALG